MTTDLSTLGIYAIPLLLAITLHEFGHAGMAHLLGDPTPKRLGRLTLNPLRHLDPIGTLLVPAMLWMTGAPLFGWAKPVPVQTQSLRPRRLGMAGVALAGPLTNGIMALCWTLIWHSINNPTTMLASMALFGIKINVLLAAFNSLPIPPLDGSRLLTCWLPTRWQATLAQAEPYGLVLVMLLVSTGQLTPILQPLIRAAYAWLDL